MSHDLDFNIGSVILHKYFVILGFLTKKIKRNNVYGNFEVLYNPQTFLCL